MNKKYFFFDVDGTLTTTDQQEENSIMKSTLQTIESLRNNGHFVAIATGRSLAMAKDYARITNIPNMVTNGGDGLYLNGKVLRMDSLDREKCIQICEELQLLEIEFAIVDGDCLTYQCCNKKFCEKTKGSLTMMKAIINEDFDFHQVKEFHKIFVAVSPEEEETLHCKNILPYMRYHDNGIVFESDNKYAGIEKMMHYLEAPVEDIVVFGDGKNDISMFKQASFSIAMGNAVEELKQNADFITKRNDEDGITYACQYFKWI